MAGGGPAPGPGCLSGPGPTEFGRTVQYLLACKHGRGRYSEHFVLRHSDEPLPAVLAD